MIKCAVPYLGKEDPIELKDVPLELIKQQNPKRANIMSIMKSKVDELTHENTKLKQSHEYIYKTDDIFVYLNLLKDSNDDIFSFN